jgi:hypothetical protein
VLQPVVHPRFDVPPRIKCAILAHIYHIKIITNSKFANFYVPHRCTNHKYYFTDHLGEQLKILNNQSHEIKNKVIIYLNSTYYVVLFLAAFISKLESIASARSWHSICLYNIDPKCPQNHCAVENQVKGGAR